MARGRSKKKPQTPVRGSISVNLPSSSGTNNRFEVPDENQIQQSFHGDYSQEIELTDMEEQLLARLGEQEELERIREEHLLHQERALKEKEDRLIRKQLELEGIADELLAARRAAEMEKKNKEIENKQIKVLEISIEELKEVTEKREASIQELNKVILAKDSRIHNFVEMMAENDEKVQDLEKQVSKAKKDFQSFKNSEFMAVKRDLNSVNLKLSAKERELKSISESSAQKEAQLIGLRQQLAPKDKIIFALRKDLEVQGEDFQKRLKRATAPPIQRRQMVDSICEVKADTIKSFIASAGKSMSKDKIIQAQQTFIDNFQEELSCGVCMEPAFRPFALNSCGHIFCYSCLSKWFRQPLEHEANLVGHWLSSEDRRLKEIELNWKRVKICPNCRVIVKFPPGEIHAIRSLISYLDQSQLLTLKGNSQIGNDSGVLTEAERREERGENIGKGDELWKEIFDPRTRIKVFGSKDDSD